MNLIQKAKIFFKEVWAEMRRVSWLSKKDILRYTLIVLAVTIVVAVFLGGLDFVFTSIVKNLILNSF
ncbi:MAG: preprotein translocase subunit SecE [Patescibacteria group bacterium]